jgi:cysteine desulfurase family protein (TIGR01976 family)
VTTSSDVIESPIDIGALRAHFPALRSGTAYFDGPGGSQVPDTVIDAVADTFRAGIANRGRVTAAERVADDTVLAARAAMADLLGAEAGGIVFGRSMTALTFEMARTLAATWAPGDEIVVTRLDHDANIRPWLIAAQRAGVTVRWAEFDAASAELPVANVAAVISGRTRLVAVTAASNLLGTRPDVAAISATAHLAGALTYVDAVHATAHGPIDMAELGADLLVCSPYKFFGPHCGVLAGRVDLLATLHPDKLLPSSDAVPERFELGTLPYELMAGTTAAVDFLASLAGQAHRVAGDRRQQLLAAWGSLDEHEQRLRQRIEAGLAELPGVIVHSRAARRTPTLLLTFADHSPEQAYRFLAERGVNAPAGSFYAIEASRFLGLGDGGGLRIGLAPYNSDADVDRLLAGLAEFLS